MTSKPYLIDGKYIDVLKEDWDVLVILDACRFDMFEKVCNTYFDGGRLKKAISPSVRTMHWLNDIFTDKYDDIVYVSANPYVNSKIKVADKHNYTFQGTKHFHKIVDVWLNGWDEKVKSIEPNSVNDEFFRIKDKFRNKRFILHYMQPHDPYIADRYGKYIVNEYERSFIPKACGDEHKLNEKKGIGSLKSLATNFILRVFGHSAVWKLHNAIPGKYPKSQQAQIYLNEGWEGIRKAYLENLELVLGSVKKVVESFDGKVLITADHGEFLGEYGLFGHPEGYRKPENTEVPWFTIQGKGGKSQTKKKYGEIGYETRLRGDEEYQSDEEIIKKRLESLGYM